MDPAQSQARAALGGAEQPPSGNITPQTFLLQQRHPESLPSAGFISAQPEIKDNPQDKCPLPPDSSGDGSSARSLLEAALPPRALACLSA